MRPHAITTYPVVGYREISFFDKTLQMPRLALIWYPVEPHVKGSVSPNPWDIFKIALNSSIAHPKTKKPVIILSSGYKCSSHQLSWLTNQLVYNGYIVLGIEHVDALKGKPQINHWKRAQDIHTALDQFASDSFSEAADFHQVGIAGFSLGGTTAIRVIGGTSTRLDPFAPKPSDAYIEEFDPIDETTLDRKKMAQDWTDSRIKAAFLMAPAWGWIFDKKGLQTIHIPTYIIAPVADHVLITQKNAGFFAKNIPHAVYQIIPGPANHFIFIAEPREKKRVPSKLKPLITDHPDVDRRWMQFEVAEKAVAFFHAMFSKE